MNSAGTSPAAIEPVLSVTIPAHNEEKYIAPCIESIPSSARSAAQRVEVVVAQDLFTDRTDASRYSMQCWREGERAAVPQATALA